MMVERSKDYFDAYSENCDGIYAAGGSIDEVKADAEKAIELIKKTLPECQWPNEIRGDFEIEWKFGQFSGVLFKFHVFGRNGENDWYQPKTIVQLPESSCCAKKEAD